MPIYEYRCGACGHEFESLQKFTDSPLKVCPACGKASLSKLLSAAGFQLKGSGWYVTDFKSSGAKPAAKSAADNAGESKSAEAKNASPADSKNASQGDSKKATTGEAATAAAPPAAATAPTTGER